MAVVQYVEVHWKNSTMFLQVQENEPLVVIKKKVEGVLNVSVENQQLYFKGKCIDDTKTFLDYGVNAKSVTSADTVVIFLIIRNKSSTR